MGVAAYNRSSEAGRQILAERYHRDDAFTLMDDINAMPKHGGPGGNLPFNEAHITNSHGAFWIEDASKEPGSSFAYHYPTLRELVRSWNIVLVGYDYSSKEWSAIPCDPSTL